MFWTLERVNWREEATGIGARKRSTAAIHAAEGGTGTLAGTGAVNGAAETFVCTGTDTAAHVSAREAHALAGAQAPARACASVHAQAHALVGSRACENRRGPRGTPWDQARRQCAAPSPSMPWGWALA